MATINVRELQTPIRQCYNDDPTAAQIRLKVQSAPADLLRSAEKYCVVLNTLRNGLPLESAFSLKQG